MLIDLFSGAGGLSSGFEMAGFKIGLSVEINPNFSKTYRFNHKNTTHVNEDIKKLDHEKIRKKYLEDEFIEGIVGGPPCTGFSSVGNRKINDSRNMLIYYFIKWVDFFKPEFFVMENVPGILSMSKGNVVKKIKRMYHDIGYSCQEKMLLTADYGIPQLRKRVFFIGLKGNIKRLNVQKMHETSYITVNDAISDVLDIPPFTPNSKNHSFKMYLKPPKTKYQHYLRKNSDKLYDHIAPKHGDLVRKRISLIKPGENHESLPEEYQLKGGYPNIYGRLQLEKPADTITGNCGCVSAPGRFIHPTQDRALSIREAARLQSFPDNYRFFGNLNEKYKQVGNAVPPLLAFAVAKSIKLLIL